MNTMDPDEGSIAVIAFYFYHVVFQLPTKLLVPLVSETINSKSLFPRFTV